MPYGPGTYGSQKEDLKRKRRIQRKKMMYGGRVKKNDGGVLKDPTNKGLASLPKKVRNKMGFKKKEAKYNGYT